MSTKHDVETPCRKAHERRLVIDRMQVGLIEPDARGYASEKEALDDE